MAMQGKGFEGQQIRNWLREGRDKGWRARQRIDHIDDEACFREMEFLALDIRINCRERDVVSPLLISALSSAVDLSVSQLLAYAFRNL